MSVTLISMAMAIALSAIVWRMLRDERQRSLARVKTLTTFANASPRTLASDSLYDRSMIASVADDFPLLESSRTEPALFSGSGARSPWIGRVGIIACLALAVAAVKLLPAAHRDRFVASAGPSTSAAATPVAAPLELLSLRDAHEGGSFSIKGLVQNPADGATLAHVEATAIAFDEGGTFVASGRALLDVPTLAPGDESPFLVTMPVAANVARYRIAFRTDDGRVIAHVDRRQTAADGAKAKADTSEARVQ
ncbi:MAG: FxLYD domain-containing protein [Vicinamibacterales bacterium]